MLSVPTSNHNLGVNRAKFNAVVYRSFPTSNHNPRPRRVAQLFVVYRSFPTSNHNNHRAFAEKARVVYRSFPTSNHNDSVIGLNIKELYIVRFLHQTTTTDSINVNLSSCISFVSYIKPQLKHLKVFGTVRCISFVSYIKPQLMLPSILRKTVVYRSFPTSNHNSNFVAGDVVSLYIVRFLHQTTTRKRGELVETELYIVRFLHQTTTIKHSTFAIMS